ncbi:DUF6177 family protein [Arthrobacter sp. D3-16]
MSAAPLVLVPTQALTPWLNRTMLKELRKAVIDAPPRSMVALQTRHEAAISYPMLAFMKAAAILWVTEGPDGHLENALMAHGQDVGHPAPPAVRVHGSVLHAASDELILGSFTGRMLLTSTGGEPDRVGPTEPLVNDWETGSLTGWFRQHMPLGILLLSGPGFAGVMTACRTEAGVVESFDVLLQGNQAEGGFAGSDQRPAWNPALRANQVEAAIESNVQNFGVELHFGARGLGVHAGGDALVRPQLLVLGPALHRGLEISSTAHPGVDFEVRGSSPFEHLILQYPSGFTWDGGRTRDLHQQILAGVAS